MDDPSRITELEVEFRWDDVNGVDYTPKVKDQRGCGACYALATIGMLESRIKIWFDEDVELSTQFVLQCNFMAEGCHGGWGVLDGFFLENFYTVAENCAPYEAQTTVDGCQRYSHCKPVAKVKDTYFVGGHYGGMSEQDIMKELRARGPLLFDFNADRRF